MHFWLGATIVNGACSSEDEVTITNYESPAIADAGPDQVLYDVNSTTLEGNIPDVGFGTWTQISGPNAALFINETIHNTVITELIPGTYILRWTLSNGICDSNFDEVSITIIKEELIIPEGFSPNGDGVNDTFVILGLDGYPSSRMVIMNRWGNKVFEENPYNNNWDGASSFGFTVGKKELPTGTYFYILDLGNGQSVLKGFIYLQR